MVCYVNRILNQDGNYKVLAVRMGTPGQRDRDGHEPRAPDKELLLEPGENSRLVPALGGGGVGGGDAQAQMHAALDAWSACSP